MKPWLVYSLMFIAVLGVLIVIAANTYSPKEDPALIEMREKNEQFVTDLKNKSALAESLADAHLELIRVRDGEAEANLYAHCTYGDPPKTKAHQELCKKVIARIAREDAAAVAAQKKADNNW